MANFFESLLGATIPGRAISDYRQRDALRNFSGELQGQDLTAPGARQAALAKYGQITGDLAPLLGTNKQQDLPAALQLANEYESAIQSGNIDRANRIAAFAKTVDKNVMMTPTGQYAPLPGLPDALGQLEYGKNYGGTVGDLTAQGQLKPGVEGAVRGAQLAQDLQFRPDIEGGVRTSTGEAELMTEKKKTFPKAQSALNSLESKTETVVSNIDKAIDTISPFSTGYGAFLSALPNTDARALNNYLDTIKANIGFDKLQEMRDNSPTGGALGQVSEFENRLLQAVQGALDPKQTEQLKENLQIIKENYPKVIEERKRAFQQDYAPFIGGGQTRQPESRPPSSKITVSNGIETFQIDPADLADAQADGFEVQ